MRVMLAGPLGAGGLPRGLASPPGSSRQGRQPAVVAGSGAASGAPPPCTAAAAGREGGGASGLQIKELFFSRCRHLPSLPAGEDGLCLGAGLLRFPGCYVDFKAV